MAQLQLSRLSRAAGSAGVYARSVLHEPLDVWRNAATSFVGQNASAGSKCLLLVSEPELKFVGSPLSASLRKAGFNPYTHGLRAGAAVPEASAIRDAASLAGRTGCTWMVVAGPPELLNFGKAVAAAAAAAGGDALKTARKDAHGHLVCETPSLPTITVPTTWCFDAASAVHDVYAGPGNSTTLRAHPASPQTALFDGFLLGRLYGGPGSLRDALGLLALAAEAGLSARCGASNGDPELAAAVAAAMQQSVLLVRRALQRGSRPPSDEEREADNQHAALASAATAALHANGALGITHALPAVAQQMFRTPYAASLGALAPHVLDWLWSGLECSDALAAAEEEDKEAEEEEEEAERDEDEDASRVSGAANAAGGDSAMAEAKAIAAAAAASRAEKLRRARHLQLASRLLVATCSSSLSLSPAASVSSSSSASSSAASSFSATLRSLSSRVQRGDGDGIFSAVWAALFAQGIAPGSTDECAAVLRPPLRLTPAEQELLAATAELHDSALRAPLPPSKADLSGLLSAVLR